MRVLLPIARVNRFAMRLKCEGTAALVGVTPPSSSPRSGTHPIPEILARPNLFLTTLLRTQFLRAIRLEFKEVNPTLDRRFFYFFS